MRALGDVRPSFSLHDQRDILFVDAEVPCQRAHACRASSNRGTNRSHIIRSDLGIPVSLAPWAQFPLVRPKYWGGDSQAGFPSTHDSLSETSCGYGASWITCPFRQVLSFTKCIDMAIRSQIGRLFAVRGPAAILWRVVTIGINAINRQVTAVSIARGPFAKGGKTSGPFWTDRNTTSSVTWKRDVLGPCATGDHCLPDGVYAVARACQIALLERVNSISSRSIYLAGEVT